MSFEKKSIGVGEMALRARPVAGFMKTGDQIQDLISEGYQRPVSPNLRDMTSCFDFSSEHSHDRERERERES